MKLADELGELLVSSFQVFPAMAERRQIRVIVLMANVRISLEYGPEPLVRIARPISDRTKLIGTSGNMPFVPGN